LGVIDIQKNGCGSGTGLSLIVKSRSPGVWCYELQEDGQKTEAAAVVFGVAMSGKQKSYRTLCGLKDV
jgi:hypothetical protein